MHPSRNGCSGALQLTARTQRPRREGGGLAHEGPLCSRRRRGGSCGCAEGQGGGWVEVGGTAGHSGRAPPAQLGSSAAVVPSAAAARGKATGHLASSTWLLGRRPSASLEPLALFLQQVVVVFVLGDEERPHVGCTGRCAGRHAGAVRCGQAQAGRLGVPRCGSGCECGSARLHGLPHSAAPRPRPAPVTKPNPKTYWFSTRAGIPACHAPAVPLQRLSSMLLAAEQAASPHLPPAAPGTSRAADQGTPPQERWGHTRGT